MGASAAKTIWKRSVPVSETGPHRTATKIGDALFPGWPLRISHFVTLRSSKAPITVCESATRRCLPPGKRFFFPLLAPATAASVPNPLGLRVEFFKACSGSEIKGLPISIWGGFGLPKCGDVFISSPFDPVIPWRVALQQSPPLFHWTQKLNPFKSRVNCWPIRAGPIKGKSRDEISKRRLPLTTLITVSDKERSSGPSYEKD